MIAAHNGTSYNRWNHSLDILSVYSRERSVFMNDAVIDQSVAHAKPTGA